MENELTEEQKEAQRKEREKQVKQAINNSNKHMKNFKVYVAVYQSESKAQTSHITEEEYKKMQTQKFINSKHEQEFFKNMPDSDKYVDVRTTVIDENNYPLAFHPMIWCILTLEEKISFCKIAWKKELGRDLKEFCNYNSNGVVLVGKNYQGSLNVGSFFRDDVISSDILTEIVKAENTLKFNYYFHKSQEKQYNTLLDFESFEELRYTSPIELKSDDLSKVSSKAKAFFFDDIYRRKTRRGIEQALYSIKDNMDIVKDLLPQFEQYMDEELQGIAETEKFIGETIGFMQKEKDLEYLRIKTDIFNNDSIEKYNAIAREYNKLVEEYKNPEDAISALDLRNEIDKLYAKLQAEEKNIIPFETVKEHFKDYFEKKPVSKTDKHKNKKKTQQLSKEELEKLN